MAAKTLFSFGAEEPFTGDAATIGKLLPSVPGHVGEHLVRLLVRRPEASWSIGNVKRRGRALLLDDDLAGHRSWGPTREYQHNLHDLNDHATHRLMSATGRGGTLSCGPAYFDKSFHYWAVDVLPEDAAAVLIAYLSYRATGCLGLVHWYLTQDPGYYPRTHSSHESQRCRPPAPIDWAGLPKLNPDTASRCQTCLSGDVRQTYLNKMPGRFPV